MHLPSFDYRAARSVEEAIASWAKKPGAAYLAGGTDLLPQMRTGRRAAKRLIDVKRLKELGGIRGLEDGGVAIGAAVPLAEIESHPAVIRAFPLLAECCRAVGAPPLRNRATMAGNVCNASPAADTAVALLGLEASVVAAGPGGRRSVPISAFFTGPGATALVPGELVVEIVLPGASAGVKGSYLRMARRRGMDLATLGVLVARSGNGGPPAYRVALAAVAPTPLRVAKAEALLNRRGAGAAAEAAEIARAACYPITDIRGTAEYRREMVGVLTARGLKALG